MVLYDDEPRAVVVRHTLATTSTSLLVIQARCSGQKGVTMSHIILFDATLYLRKSRKSIPYYDQTYVDQPLVDGSLHWFHESYGRMELYKIHAVDDDHSIAEPMHRVIYTNDSECSHYMMHPELALVDLEIRKCTEHYV